jgi:hypothetical protein
MVNYAKEILPPYVILIAAKNLNAYDVIATQRLIMRLRSLDSSLHFVSLRLVLERSEGMTI